MSASTSGTADDSDGTFGFSWDFGDGSPPVSDDFSPAHTYAAAGTYQVTLTVTDDRGAVTVSAPLTITVS